MAEEPQAQPKAEEQTQPATRGALAAMVAEKVSQIESDRKDATPKPAEAKGEEKPPVEKEKTVPLKALQEARAKARKAEEEKSAIEKRIDALEASLKEREVRKDDPDSEYFKANAEDPHVRRTKTHDEAIESLRQEINSLRQQRDQESAARAKEWIDEQVTGLRKEFKGLDEAVFKSDEDGEISDSLKDFFRRASKIDYDDDEEEASKQFRAQFVGHFADEILKAQTAQAAADAMKKREEEQKAASIVGKPARPVGTPSAFARHGDLQKRIIEKLDAAGAR